MSKFNIKLSELMQSENLSTVTANKKIGISKAQLGRYLSGFYEPTLKNLLKICAYFNCSIDYALGLDDNINRYKNYNEPRFTKFINRYLALLKINKTNHFRVCQILDINRNNLVYWNKHQALPTTDTLYRLAIHLHTSVEYLIGRVD